MTTNVPRWAVEPLTFPTTGFVLIDPAEKVEEESLVTYNRDVYYPMKIGDVVDNRYQIVAKLGYGVTSTVWLCRDLTQQCKFFTLKVFINTIVDSPELKIFRHLQKITPSSNHSGQFCVRKMERSFSIKGPKGDHLVLLMEPLGMSMSTFQELQESRVLAPVFAKVTAQHLLLGIDFLHEKANIIHTDLHSGNILVGDQVETVLPDIEQCEMTKPTQRKIDTDGTVIHTSRFFLGTGLGTSTISDFGQARIGDICTGGAMPTQYRAPEVILKMKWGREVDIWSLGLMMWDFIEPKPLFRIYDKDNVELNDAHHLAAMTALFGEPPTDFLKRSEETKKYWDETGKWIGPVPLPDIGRLPGRITKYADFDLSVFFDFMMCHLMWLPEQRSAPSELYCHPFLENVEEEVREANAAREAAKAKEETE